MDRFEELAMRFVPPGGGKVHCSETARSDFSATAVCEFATRADQNCAAWWRGNTPPGFRAGISRSGALLLSRYFDGEQQELQLTEKIDIADEHRAVILVKVDAD
jgi:hypothetical protein